MSQDVISDCLNQIMNAKKAKKQEVKIKKYSKFLISVLEVIKNLGYLDYSIEGRELEIKFEEINECKAIKPRYQVSADMIERYVRRYLPARDIGTLIISTNKGLVTHEEAFEENIGGSLIAFFY